MPSNLCCWFHVVLITMCNIRKATEISLKTCIYTSSLVSSNQPWMLNYNKWLFRLVSLFWWNCMNRTIQIKLTFIVWWFFHCFLMFEGEISLQVNETKVCLRRYSSWFGLVKVMLNYLILIGTLWKCSIDCDRKTNDLVEVLEFGCFKKENAKRSRKVTSWNGSKASFSIIKSELVFGNPLTKNYKNLKKITKPCQKPSHLLSALDHEFDLVFEIH